ncbi:MAG: LysE family translocator [Neisseriaceae bacterium]|nr:LysE family translocator [Neisseriaceae bacterium]MBP6861594.1 LysE family translocator [Neisseriaceae bacterium]
MSFSLYLSIFTFLLIAAVTPGPNNILLTTTAANFGIGRALKPMFGIMLGMQVLLLLVASGVGSLIILHPSIHLALKVMGSVYLLWLAYKLASARFETLDTETAPAQPVKFYQGALLQFLNPKAWLMALGSISSFSLMGDLYVPSVIAISVIMVGVNFIASAVWLGFGSLISHLLRSPRSWRLFNVTMGVLTAACVPLVWW